MVILLNSNSHTRRHECVPESFFLFPSDASVTLPDFPPAKIKLMTKTARPSNYIQEKFDSNATKYIAEDVLLLKSE